MDYDARVHSLFCSTSEWQQSSARKTIFVGASNQGASSGATSAASLHRNSIDKWTLAVDERKGPEIQRKFSNMAAQLPDGEYRIISDPVLSTDALFRACLGWAHGRFSYRVEGGVPLRQGARLVIEDGTDLNHVVALSAAATMIRELIETPSNLLGPSDLASRIVDLGQFYAGQVTSYAGDRTFTTKFPLVAAVGRAGRSPPCVVDLRWHGGNVMTVALVGKGVCFDAGGANLKSTESIRHMKRDMAGAAILMGLARAVMALRLPVSLRLVVPCLENLLSPEGIRPSDVLRAGDGRLVEIVNTDAEGRLVLADVLYFADADSPDVLIDCGSLTGSSRSVLGPDFAVAMSNDSCSLASLSQISLEAEDPVWPLPLWAPYRDWIASRVADISNTSEGLKMAGPILAGLFLAGFVRHTTTWIHVDASGWNPISMCGRPFGAEATAFFALERLLRRLVTERQAKCQR